MQKKSLVFLRQLSVYKIKKMFIFKSVVVTFVCFFCYFFLPCSESCHTSDILCEPKVSWTLLLVLSSARGEHLQCHDVWLVDVDPGHFKAPHSLKVMIPINSKSAFISIIGRAKRQ